ncbi:MAG: SpoIID/LytB domain-containing protein [Bacteroidales bacterium]|nr:SpoIID/LytB domain-containing protein [Bacteroidales bacterium]
MMTPVVNVGILKESEIRFKLQGSFSDPGKKKYSEGQYIARYKDGTIELEMNGRNSLVGAGLFLQPEGGDTGSFTLFDVTIGINFHWQKKEDQVFRGGIMLSALAGKIQIINVLPVEDYLISVISSEMSANSSLEMLKAHAVISRSWLLAQIEKGKSLKAKSSKYQSVFVNNDERIVWYDREDHTGFDVCADDHCQRYQGITRASTPLVVQAVKQTEGEVLVYNGNLCDTRFSKCCGGITEVFENTWEPINHPYLQRIYDHAEDRPETQIDLTGEEAARAWIMSVPDAFCNTSDRSVLSQVLNDYDQTTRDFFRWKIGYSGIELGDLIRKRIGLDFGVVQDLIPLQRGTSGRIIRLKIVGSLKTMILGKELEIRKALSETHLYSSAFVVEKVTEGDSTRFILNGAGWGHGVGLCQIGAAVMGSKGYSYREILMHYFRGAELKKRY